MRRFLLLSLVVIAFFSCDKKEDVAGFQYPDSKVWKHRVNSIEELKEAVENFDGIEVDIFYHPKRKDIYVGHSYADSVNNLRFDDFLSSMNDSKKKDLCYWLDFKHLDEKNAEQAIPALDIIVEKHKIKDKLFVESYSQKALKTAKGNGYFTMLWVTSLSYKEYKTLNDTITVMDNIRNCINNVKPDAISCVSAMFPILCDSFPEQKIHFWDTPKKYTPENVEFTKNICQNENVKIVLVDYPNSIEH